MTQLAIEQTYADLLAMPDDGKLYELVRGQITEKEMGRRATGTASKILLLLGRLINDRRLGSIANEQYISCFPWLGHHTRRPDVSYFSYERLPEGFSIEDQITVAPNWVAEVISRHDNAIDVEEKLEEYLRAGIDLVWIVNPSTRTVRVHRGDGSVAVYHENDTIDGWTVFPDFRATVADLFPQAVGK